MQQGVEIFIQHGTSHLDALLHKMRVDAGDGEPLITRRAGGLGGCIGRCEGDGGQHILPVRRKADQVVAVGAIAMHQHHQMGGGTAFGREGGTGQC
jgi:hypothetical protein